MTLATVRRLLRLQMREFRTAHGNSIGLSHWCKTNRVNAANASEFLRGKKSPSADLLKALGLEWRIVQKEKGRAA